MKQKYCLQSVAPFRSINQAHLNHSKNKQTYSFSKSIRFEPTNTICPVSTYRGNQSNAKRTGAIIGYGNKMSIAKESISPGSNRYKIKTIFDNNLDKNKGHTLTLSRQKISYQSYIDHNRIKLPGVGKYHLQTETAVRNQKAPVFTLRKKTKVHDLTQTIEPQNNNPSPAHYQNNPENYNRSSFGSQFKRLSYSGSKSKRFFDPDNKVPGPGNYENPTDLSAKGKYVMSSHQGGTRAKFDRTKRVTRFEAAQQASKKIPGPGSYRQSSQFGQYDGNVYEHSSSRTSLRQRY